MFFVTSVQLVMIKSPSAEAHPSFVFTCNQSQPQASWTNLTVMPHTQGEVFNPNLR
jgi:hypothetical protein